MLFRINENICINCWACERYCPVKAIRWRLEIQIIAEDCLGCTICYAVCPVNAIVPYESHRNPARPNLAWTKMDQVRSQVIARGPIAKDRRQKQELDSNGH